MGVNITPVVIGKQAGALRCRHAGEPPLQRVVGFEKTGRWVLVWVESQGLLVSVPQEAPQVMVIEQETVEDHFLSGEVGVEFGWCDPVGDAGRKHQQPEARANEDDQRGYTARLDTEMLCRQGANGHHIQQKKPGKQK